MSIIVQFAPPPSANKIWRNVNGKMLKSAEYRKWLDNVPWYVWLGSPKSTLRGPCAVSLHIPRKSKLSDLDNRIKPCLDALQASGVIENDRQVIRIIAQWAAPGSEFVTAEVYEVQA